MTESAAGYAVYLFEQAVEALGDAVRPYLKDGASGPHVCCHAVDTAGAFVEMNLRSRTDGGEPAEIELMVPAQMVRMIVSMRVDETFGFTVRGDELRTTPFPVVGPDAPSPRAPSAAVPATTAQAGAGGSPVAEDDRRRPPEG